MKSYIAYGVSIIVIVASASLVIFLPINNDIKAVFSLPGIAGLFSLLVQGWRDQIAYERQAELQRNQQDFDLAIASHMANVVFDKQVDFCEKYSQKLRSIVQEMFKDGPSDKTISYSQELRDIRNEYAPWISKELTQKIKPFESALNEIASLEVLQKLNPNDPSRYSTIDRMFKYMQNY